MSTFKILLKNKARVSGTVTENCVLPNQLKEKSEMEEMTFL